MSLWSVLGNKLNIYCTKCSQCVMVLKKVRFIYLIRRYSILQVIEVENTCWNWSIHLKKQYGFIIFNTSSIIGFLLPWLPLGALVPTLLHQKTATVLPQLHHHSNRIFDPACGNLDLDVDRSGIKEAYWLKAAAVQRRGGGGCGGGGDWVWAVTDSRRPGRRQDSGVHYSRQAQNRPSAAACSTSIKVAHKGVKTTVCLFKKYVYSLLC